MRKERIQKSVAMMCLILITIAAGLVLSGCAKKEASVSEATSGEKKEVIRWRLQSYAGPALNDFVVKNA
ncbi:MAG: hypothetical protein ABIJ86_02905, partial [Spirochaetota bacterium]